MISRIQKDEISDHIKIMKKCENKIVYTIERSIYEQHSKMYSVLLGREATILRDIN